MEICFNEHVLYAGAYLLTWVIYERSWVWLRNLKLWKYSTLSCESSYSFFSEKKLYSKDILFRKSSSFNEKVQRKIRTVYIDVKPLTKAHVHLRIGIRTGFFTNTKTGKKFRRANWWEILRQASGCGWKNRKSFQSIHLINPQTLWENENITCYFTW